MSSGSGSGSGEDWGWSGDWGIFWRVGWLNFGEIYGLLHLM